MIPFILAILFNLVLLFWIQPFYQIDLLQGFAASILASCIMLIIALSVTILSDNKMEGMTYFKLINTITILPLLAFFAPKLQWLFTLIPTHWLFQSIELLLEYRSAWVMLVIGLAYSSIWIFVLVGIFARKHFQ